ncbi:MAG: phosphoenolpyruvate carboxykinase, partial [Lentisphaeria bacterium]|nr:phosphoenolpyruvate carboxykinase [Lentisphaeria bacterium]
MSQYSALLQAKMDAASYNKLMVIDNAQVNEFVANAIELVDPASVFVGDDSAADSAFCRMRAIDGLEELQLSTNGHTVHFDNYYDQARKKEVTKYLVPADVELDKNLNQMEREAGVKEMDDLQRGSYKGRIMFVRFFCLGTTGSSFSIPCLQITDSAYVVHSEDLLYRGGYEEFKRQSAADPSFEFFKYLHATGEMTERNTAKNIDLNRVYMDYTK